MRSNAVNVTVAMGLVCLSVITAIPLIMYSEADDAPGGVLLGILLIIGTAAFALRSVTRSPGGPAGHAGMDYHVLEERLHVTQSQLDDLQGEVAQLEEKLSFTQSLLENRSPTHSMLPPRA